VLFIVHVLFNSHQQSLPSSPTLSLLAIHDEHTHVPPLSHPIGTTFFRFVFPPEGFLAILVAELGAEVAFDEVFGFALSLVVCVTGRGAGAATDSDGEGEVAVTALVVSFVVRGA
jgi:hypothetical protein